MASASAVHVLSWPYAAAAWAVIAVYRLLAERARRKTLVDLVSHSPAGTIVVMEKGPGRPTMWVRVGDGSPCQPSEAGVGGDGGRIFVRSQGAAGSLSGLYHSVYDVSVTLLGRGELDGGG